MYWDLHTYKKSHVSAGEFPPSSFNSIKIPLFHGNLQRMSRCPGAQALKHNWEYGIKMLNLFIGFLNVLECKLQSRDF